MNRSVRMTAFALGVLLGGSQSFFALNPTLDISQYGHTAWKIRDGFKARTAFAMAQTPDGYLWLGTEFGLFRSDSVAFLRWEPPAGQHLPATPYSLLVSHDGTLWIGTFVGLASWKDGKLRQYPEMGPADGSIPGGPSSWGPTFAESADGALWCLSREDIQVINPRHIVSNTLSPPVHIEVEIRYGDHEFRLRVRDDGKGIDPAVLSRHDIQGHYGLPGMRERAKLVGGRLAVWSEIGVGTELELIIPGAKAYSSARRRSWLAQRLAGKT